MKIKKTLFIIGQQKSMLQHAQSILQEHFSEIRTFTDPDELLHLLNEGSPQFILFGGAVSEATRTRIKSEVEQNKLQIKFIDPPKDHDENDLSLEAINCIIQLLKV